MITRKAQRLSLKRPRSTRMFGIFGCLSCLFVAPRCKARIASSSSSFCHIYPIRVRMKLVKYILTNMSISSIFGLWLYQPTHCALVTDRQIPCSNNTDNCL